MRVEPKSFGRLQSADYRRRVFQMVQRPQPNVHGMDHAGRTNDVGIAKRVVSTTTSGTDAEIQTVDLPYRPAMADATATAPRHIDEPSGLRHSGVMKEKTIGNGNGTLGSPLAADFTGLGVIPAASLLSVVDVDQVIPVLLGPQYGHEPVVIGADSNRMSRVSRIQFDA